MKAELPVKSEGFYEGHGDGKKDTRKKKFRNENKYGDYRTVEDQRKLDLEAQRVKKLEEENARLKADHKKYKEIIEQLDALGGMVGSLKDRARKTSKENQYEPKAYARGLRRAKKPNSSRKDKQTDIANKQRREDKENDRW